MFPAQQVVQGTLFDNRESILEQPVLTIQALTSLTLGVLLVNSTSL